MNNLYKIKFIYYNSHRDKFVVAHDYGDAEYKFNSWMGDEEYECSILDISLIESNILV